MKKGKLTPFASDIWRCHTPNLLKEIFQNPHTEILSKPFHIFGKILYQVAERASQLNDPQLNALMMRLTLYSAADPEIPDYDPKLYDRVVAEGGFAVLKEKAKKEGLKS